MLDVDSFFKAAAPAATRLRHLYAINEVRMMLERSNDEKSYYWRSERWLRVGKSTTKKGDTVGPVPDGELHYDDGDIVAIEVELSTKKRDDLEAKLAALVYKRSDKLQRQICPITIKPTMMRCGSMCHQRRADFRAFPICFGDFSEYSLLDFRFHLPVKEEMRVSYMMSVRVV